MQFGVGAKKIELDKKRTQIFANPETARKANKRKQQNVIQIGVDTKNKALEVAYIYGLEETHTPRKEVFSGKWHLVKNTYWESKKSQAVKEDTLVSDAVAKVQKATEKTMSAKSVSSTTDNSLKTSKVSSEKGVNLAGQVVPETSPEKAKQAADYFIQQAIAENKAKKANNSIQTAKNDKILQKSTEKRVVKAKSQDKQAEITYGKRQGLEKLPDIPVVRLNGNEFDAETLADMRKLADDFLRVLQTSKAKLHNDEQNWDLSINRADRKKMGDNENLPKHTTQAVAGIRDLAKNAVLVETHEDAKHSNPDVIAIHRLYAPVQIGDTLYRAKLTVKDYVLNNDTQRKQLHAIETVEIEKETAGLGTLPSSEQGQKTAQPTTLRDKISISELLQNAKSDIDGKPLIDEKNQSSVSNKSVSQSKKAKGDKQDEVSGKLKDNDTATKDNKKPAIRWKIVEKYGVYDGKFHDQIINYENFYIVGKPQKGEFANLKIQKTDGKYPIHGEYLSLGIFDSVANAKKYVQRIVNGEISLDEVINEAQKQANRETIADFERLKLFIGKAKGTNTNSGSLKQQKSFNPATVKPATEEQIKQAVVTPKRQASNFTEARQQAKAFQGKDIVNKHANMTAVVSRNNLDKMLSAKAVGKSGNAELHALAVANVDTLFENAIYGWAKPDRDNDPNIKAVHRLFATLHTENGDYIVKMTVKETARTDNKNGLYTVEALAIEKEIPVAQWVVSTVRDDNLDPTTIRSTGNIESLIKNAQSVNTKLSEWQKAVEKQGYESNLDYKHRLAETVSNNYSPKEKRLLAAEMLAKVMYETGRKSKIEKYHDKQAIARRVVALTERNELNYHQVSFEIEHLLKNGDFAFAKMKKNGKVTPDTLYPEYPAKQPTNALEYVKAFEKSLNLDTHGRNTYQEWFDDIVDFINQGNVSIGNQWTFQDAIMRLANGEITIEKNKLQDSQSTVTLDLDKWFERVFLRFADYIQNAKKHYAKKRYSLSEKTDKQQQYAQTLYSKANAIRESKASVEHKNAVIDAVKAVVGEENIKHIDITTASELQRNNRDFQSWRADDIAQIEGFQSEDTGRITLVSNAFDDMQTAGFVAWHELAHRGIGVKGRQEYRKAMVALANKHKFYRRVAAKYYGRYRKNENLQDFTSYDALEESLVDFYAAYKTGDWATFEQRNGVKVSENLKKYSERNSIQRLWNEFKAIVSQIFGIQSQALSDKQLFALLKGLDGVQGYEFDPKGSLIGERRYSLRSKLGGFIEKVFTEQDPKGELYLREVSQQEIDIVKQQQPDLDISGMAHYLVADNLKHAIKEHGTAEEQKKHPDQRPLTKQDLMRVVEVLDNFDSLTVQKRKANNSSLIYKKAFADGSIEYVERVIETSKRNKPRLITKTIWVKSPTGVETSPTQVSTPERLLNDSVANTIPNNKRFSLASNNRALAKINRGTVQGIVESNDFSYLEDEFNYNSPNEKMSPAHKKLFDTAKKAKTVKEFQAALKQIQQALLRNEIKQGRNFASMFEPFFEQVAERQDLKQYSEDDLRRIADNANFKKWFEKAHKFFKNTDGTPKVFYRGLNDIDEVRELETNASENEYGAEFFTDNAIIASTYSTMIYPHNGFIQQVAINAEKPFIVPHTSGNDWNNLLKDYTVSQVVRLFKMAGFDTKPANWDSLSHRYDDTFATSNDTISFFVQTSVKTGFEFVFDKKPDDKVYQKQFDTAKFSEIWERSEWFSNNFFVRNLQSRGKFDSVIFKNIHDNGWQASQVTPLFGDIPAGTVIAVWGDENNQAYAKELGNKGTFSKEDKRIFYSLKKSGSLKEQDTIKKQIQQNADKLQAMNPVANISGKPMTKAEVIEYMQQTGGFVVDIQDFGQVEIGKNEISDSFKYANKDAERLTYKAIKPVLKRGIRITDKADHKGRGYPTVTFAAPVVVNGVRGNMGVVVKQTNKNHYKMHRILTPNGEVFELVSVEPTMPASTPSATNPRLGEVNLSIGSTLDSNAVTDIKAQTVPNGKTRFSLNTTQSEFDATAKQYGGEKAYNQAKESGKTALTYKQWVQVRTPSFKAWFGDWENDPENASKVLNPDTGEPLVVYHGTTTTPFNEFKKDMIGSRYFADDIGFFFTSNFDTANQYAKSDFTSDYGGIIPAFIGAKNALIVNDTWTKQQGMGNVFKEEDEISFWDNYQNIILDEVNKNNADGVVIIDGKNQMVIAFNPEQIKSATDNIGTFDRQNPDIRYSLKADNQPTIKEQIRENADKLNNMPTVASVTGTAKNITALRQEVLQHLKDTGGFVVDVPNFGKVELGEKEISQSLKYIETDAEKIAYKAIKAVLKRGIRIENRNNHKDRNYSTVTFAAPIEINGVRASMAVVVKQTNKNHYKMHRVLTTNGEVFRLNANGSAGSRRERVSPNNAVQYQGGMPDLSPQHSTDKSVTDNVANSMPTVKQLSGSLKAVKEVVGKDTYDLIHTMIRAENAYGQDETNPQILYSIAKTAEKARLTFGKQLGDMAKDTYGKVRTPLMKVKKSKLFPSGWRVALGNKWKDSLNVQLQFLGRRHIVDIFDRVFKGRLKKYSDLVSDMDAMKNALSQKHDDLVRDWGKLSKEENDRLVSLMHKATLAQYDPDTRSGKIDYTKNKDNKVIKNLDEIKALHRDFAKLSPDAKRIYRQVRDNYKEHYQRVRQAMEERIVRMLDGVPDTQKDPFGAYANKKEIIEKMNNHFADGLQGVYFPLQRFGDYVVVAKDKMGKTISVSRAESANQAEEIRREYLRDFPKDKGYSVLPVQLSKDYVQSRDGAGRAFVQNLIGEFANRPDLLDGDQFDEVADIVEQMWLASMPDLSWAKHGIHRKGTAGYSEKARRAYAANMIHGTNYLARLTYSDQLQTALDDMQEFIDNNAANEDFNQVVAQRVQNEMEKRHENLMRPNTHPLATKLTGLGFVWYLGLSPASALVNLTQTWLVGLPVIGAKYGNLKTAQELLKASGQTIKGAKRDGFTFDISGSLNADEKAAFDRAVADGTIDTSQAYDLAGIADGHEDAAYFKYQRFMRGVAKMFHEAEVFNRQATFIACYRLAKQNGMNSEQAFQDAKELTYKSHFDYATSNRARVLQGNWQRVIFLFKQFGFNMLYTVYRNAYVGFLTGIAGTKEQYTAEERKQARQALLSMGVAHFTVAGVLGLPLVGTLLSVISGIAHAGGADDDWDAEEEMKKAFAAVLGKKGGNAMSYGLTRYLGVDLHGRLGLNSLIFPDVQENLEGEDWAERFTVGMSGAVVGMGVNTAKGLNQMHNGEVLKGAESMLPTALRNAIKSYRLATQGQIDRTGVVVKDDFNAAEIATTAIGFNPASLRRAMEAKSAILNTENRKNKARTALMSAYAKARMDGDKKAMQKVLQEINEWNRKNPTRRIEPKNLQASLKNRQRRIANAKHGVYLSDSHQDAYQENSYLLDE